MYIASLLVQKVTTSLLSGSFHFLPKQNTENLTVVILLSVTLSLNVTKSYVGCTIFVANIHF